MSTMTATTGYEDWTAEHHERAVKLWYRQKVNPDDTAALHAECARLKQETAHLVDYIFLLERGLGSHEARETVWPILRGGSSDPT